jgi:peptidoglycan/LPS O-acetylase OafA/YrhL
MRQKITFPNVDLLRGFAAISVLIYHVIEITTWKNFPTTGFLSWFRIGWMGVDMFFIISGLVIGLSVFRNIGKLSWRKFFLLKRFYRIIPLHYLTMLVWVFFIQPAILFDQPIKNIGSHLLFIHNLSFYYHGSINAVNWSLATEMQFYILMCIFGRLIFNSRLWTFSLLLIVLSWAWRYLSFIFPYYPHDLPSTHTQFIFSTQLIGMLDEFAFGLILAKLIILGNKSELFIKNISLKTAVLFASILLTYLSLTIFWHHSTFWDNLYMVVFFRTLLCFSFSLIILSACLIQFKGLFLKLLLPFYYLGTISYGIYLWHFPVIESLKKIQWLTPIEFMFTTLTLTLILSSLSYHYFEKPIMERLKK